MDVGIIRECGNLHYIIGTTIVLIVLYFLWNRWWRINPLAVNSPERKAAKRWTKAREKARLATYPGPYPNTWYALFRSDEVPIGTLRDKHACGLDLIVFRTSDGKPSVLDAYCPHMGAHLGFGGVMKNDCVRCPFHHWEFDGEGKCTNIPYTDKPIPAGAKVHSWPVREWGGSIYFFYHENRAAPTYELPDLSEHLNRMKYYGWHDLNYRMHVMEMMENCSDPVHFQTVHGIPDLPILRNLVHLEHNITCQHDGPLISFINKPLAYWNPIGSKKPTPLSNIVEVYTTFVGPSILVFRFATKYWGDALFVKSSLPVEPLAQHIVDVVYTDPKMPWYIVKFLKIQSIHGFEEDKPIWEHKIGRSKPLLVSGDGKIMLRRAWLKQFYENSEW
jgi:cholesterol 7-dehydrogenase